MGRVGHVIWLHFNTIFLGAMVITGCRANTRSNLSKNRSNPGWSPWWLETGQWGHGWWGGIKALRKMVAADTSELPEKSVLPLLNSRCRMVFITSSWMPSQKVKSWVTQRVNVPLVQRSPTDVSWLFHDIPFRLSAYRGSVGWLETLCQLYALPATSSGPLESPPVCHRRCHTNTIIYFFWLWKSWGSTAVL